MMERKPTTVQVGEKKDRCGITGGLCDFTEYGGGFGRLFIEKLAQGKNRTFKQRSVWG